MKFLITEHRLDEFITNYLDTFLANKNISNIDVYTVISQNTDEDNWEDFMEYDSSDGRLWISKYMLKNLNDLFGFSEDYLKNFIGKWFENKFGVKIKYIDPGQMAFEK